jgi:hypothetical protein
MSHPQVFLREEGVTLGTVNAWQVLLHMHVSAAPHPRFHAPAVAQAIDRLLEAGAITQDPVYEWRYRTTKLGARWIEQICELNLPKQLPDETP